MLKKTLLTSVAAVALMSGATIANAATDGAWSTSANVALTNDYKFRGISQSDESAALQGGFDLSHESGFYVGAWASSVDFDTNGPCCDGSLELDYYLGYGSDIGDTGFSYDVGVMAYTYPGDSGQDGDYNEIYGSIAWQDLTVGLVYSDDYYAETDEFTYLYADYSFALPNEFALDLHVGYNMLEEDGGFLSSDEDAYTDYSVSISRDYMGLNFAVAYVGTDLDDDDVFGTDWGDGAFIGTLSASF
jgi:uncharacterized protein (TIGR02001 family)